MSDAPIHVVVAAFDTPDGASNMLKTLEAARTVGLETIEDAAVAARDTHGNLHIEEPGDWGGGRRLATSDLVVPRPRLLTTRAQRGACRRRLTAPRHCR
jgi:hypothetical protein